MTAVELFTSASNAPGHRVSIALRWKGVSFHARDAMSVKSPRHPFGMLPFLRIDGFVVGQSLAILDFVEKTWRERPLLPHDHGDAAHLLAIAQYIACDVHALNNRSVHTYLNETLGLDTRATARWYRHWLLRGLGHIETIAGELSMIAGARVADWPIHTAIMIYPQLCNARNVGIALTAYPKLSNLLEAGDADPCFAWPPAFEK